MQTQYYAPANVEVSRLIQAYDAEVPYQYIRLFDTLQGTEIEKLGNVGDLQMANVDDYFDSDNVMMREFT